MHPRAQPNIIRELLAGVLSAFLAVVAAVSFARLIFSGDLQPFIAQGLGLALFSCMVASIITAIGTRYQFNVGAPRSPASAVLAVVGGSFAVLLGKQGNPDALFPTLVAFMGLTSLSTGIFFVIAGKIKLGKLIRYVPYPVIGGFIAGIGAVIVKRTFYTLTNISLSFDSIHLFFEVDALVLWLIPLFCGVLMFVLQERFKHYSVLPSLVMGVAVLFFGYFFSKGATLVDIREGGWLLGSFPSGLLWPPFNLSTFALTDWNLIADDAGHLVAIVLINVFTLLMHSSAYEVLRNDNMDLNHELFVAGVANVAVGAGGGMPSYSSMSTNNLVYDMNAVSRLTGYVFAGFCCLFFFFGGTVLSFMPNLIIGALLFYQGFAFFVLRIRDAWKTLPWIDFGILLLITATILIVGFLAGVVVGFLMFTLIFIVQYSALNVVKKELPGDIHHSNVMRTPKEMAFLEKRGGQIHLLILEGYIFFGTASQLFEKVMKQIESHDDLPLKFPIFDFSKVSGLDASAVFSFSKLLKKAQDHGFQVIYTHLSTNIRKQLKIGGAFCPEYRFCHVFSDTDHALEYCENQLLEEAGVEGEEECDLPQSLLARLKNSQQVKTLVNHLQEGSVQQGDYLFHEGDPQDGLYFIREGLVSVEVNQDGNVIRLQELGPGAVVGEIALYTESKRIASICASKDTKYYHLSTAAFDALQSESKEVSYAINYFIVDLLASRLKKANQQIQFLME